MKILIIEDNEILSKNLKTYFELEQFDCDQAHDGEVWLQKALSDSYAAILLDVHLPNISGFEICKILRNKDVQTPIIMLTSRSESRDVIEWLSIGADDYVTKPFHYEELLARIQAHIRKSHSTRKTSIDIGTIMIDTQQKSVTQDGSNVHLSSLEFNLLVFLAQNRGKTFSRIELLEHVWWEYDALMFSRTVDIYIWYLRKKLGKNIIETKKGFWYLIP